MRQAAYDCGVEHLARLCLGSCDEVGNAVYVAVGIDDQDYGDRGKQCDWRKIPNQIERRIGIDDLVDDDGQRCKEQCVAVLGLVADISSGNAGARTRLVFDYDLPAENWSHALSEHASSDVRSRPWGKTDDHVDGTGRINVHRQVEMRW